MSEEAQHAPEPADVGETVACPGCGAVYDRRYLTECCRYEAGEGYRCPACDHLLERED